MLRRGSRENTGNEKKDVTVSSDKNVVSPGTYHQYQKNPSLSVINGEGK